MENCKNNSQKLPYVGLLALVVVYPYMYMHSLIFFFIFQYLKVHLEFLQFLLKEGDIYLAWPRCKDIWDTLVANPKASGYDKEVRGVLGLPIIFISSGKQCGKNVLPFLSHCVEGLF